MFSSTTRHILKGIAATGAVGAVAYTFCDKNDAPTAPAAPEIEKKVAPAPAPVMDFSEQKTDTRSAYQKFASSADYPNLHTHNNCLANHLNPTLYKKLRSKVSMHVLLTSALERPYDITVL